MITVSVLGPISAYSDEQDAAEPKKLTLGGPLHRALFARLVAAHGRAVPLQTLINDLWVSAPTRARGSIRTFIADLRRVVEPDRGPREKPRLLLTEGTGYALRLPPGSLDADRFEHAVTTARHLPAEHVADTLARALDEWKGPAYADLEDAQWARAERAHLSQLRLHAKELWAQALIESGRAADAVPALDAHVIETPWREEGWRLLALALYASGRQAESLEVLRRATSTLIERYGLDPGPELARLEPEILAQAVTLGPRVDADDSETASAIKPARRPHGERARLRSRVDMLRSLAVNGGDELETAQRERVAAIHSAEQLGDARLTARIIGGYDVPAVWSRSDFPDVAGEVVAAAERTLTALGPDGSASARARLLSTIGIETRETATLASRRRARQAALEAERLARALGDAIGRELVDLGTRHDLATFELLGRLVRMQSLCAHGNIRDADTQADAADALAASFDSPLVTVFTTMYRALRRDLTGRPPDETAAAYQRARPLLERSGMPGLHRGVPSLAVLCLHVRHGRPLPQPNSTDWGPYSDWIEPLLLAEHGHTDAARASLHNVPDPPAGHLAEALWCLLARAAQRCADVRTEQRAQTALHPARGELAGAGSGILSLGPVTDYLP